MLFNLKRRYRESIASFIGLIGTSGVPVPGTAFCGLLTTLKIFLDTPESKTATITVTKTTSIT